MISAHFAFRLLSQMIKFLLDVMKIFHLKLKLNRTFDSSSIKIILKLIVCVSTLVLVQGCSKDSKKNNNSNSTQPPPQVEVMIPMVSTWRTSGVDEIVEFPLKSGYNYDFTVDWGDGSSESTVTSYEDPDKSHTYAAPGDYTITIKGLVEAWGTTEEETGTSPDDLSILISSPHQDQIIRVDNLGRVGWLDLSFAFYRCQNLASVSGGDTSSVTDMRAMFYRAASVTPDVGSWNTSSVTDMSYMFHGARSANPDVGEWDTSKVTDMSSMFRVATSATPDVGSWNTSSVTDMRAMFYSASSANPDVGSWDTSSVTDMSRLFWNADSANPDVGDWNTSKVIDMSSMFQDTTSANPDVSNWDTSSVTDMQQMFYSASSAHPDVGDWDTSSVTDMGRLFSDTTSVNPDVSNWNTSKVTNMSYMFLGATSANPDVSGWDTSSVIDMSHMFDGASSADPDLEEFDFTGVTNPLRFFIRNSGITTVNYSNLLISMDEQTLSPFAAVGVQFSSPAKYNSSAVDARASLISKNWNITDQGLLEDE